MAKMTWDKVVADYNKAHQGQSAPTAVVQTQSNVRTGPMTWDKVVADYRNARQGQSTSTYVNSFLKDADSFFKSANEDINGSNRFNAAEYFAERKEQADNLKKRSDIVSQYLDQYGSNYSQQDYDFLREFLSTFNTNVDDVLSQYQPSIDASAGVQTYQDAYLAYKEEQARKGQKLHIAADMLGDNHPVSGFLDMLGDWRSTPEQRGVTNQWTAQQLYTLGTLQNENPEEAIKYARSINSGTDPYQEYLNRRRGAERTRQ